MSYVLNSYLLTYLLIVGLTVIISRTVLELSQLIVHILDTLRFEPPLGVLVTTYDVHIGLTGKRVVDILLVLIELFFAIGVMAEALRANIGSKSAISLQRGQLTQNFR